jgi:hypothetical protein
VRVEYCREEPGHQTYVNCGEWRATAVDPLQFVGFPESGRTTVAGGLTGLLSDVGLAGRFCAV